MHIAKSNHHFAKKGASFCCDAIDKTGCESVDAEFHRLLESPDSGLSTRARRHLAECGSCRSLYAYLSAPAAEILLPVGACDKAQRALLSSLRPVKPLPSIRILALQLFLTFLLVAFPVVGHSGNCRIARHGLVTVARHGCGSGRRWTDPFPVFVLANDTGESSSRTGEGCGRNSRRGVFRGSGDAVPVAHTGGVFPAGTALSGSGFHHGRAGSGAVRHAGLARRAAGDGDSRRNAGRARRTAVGDCSAVHLQPAGRNAPDDVARRCTRRQHWSARPLAVMATLPVKIFSVTFLSGVRSNSCKRCCRGNRFHRQTRIKPF